MKTLLLAAAALLAVTSANAADLSLMPVKAKPRVLTTYVGSGFYFGIGTFGEVDRANITGPAGQGLSADIAGAALSGVVGYMWGDGLTWKAVDASVDWFNIGGSNGVTGNIVPASVNTQIGFTQRFLLGGPLASVLNLLPNIGTVFPTLPTPTVPVVGTVHPYVFAAAHEKDISASYLAATGKVWKFQAGLGVGAKQQLGANPMVTVDYWAEYLIPTTAVTIGTPDGAAAASTGGGARVGMTLEY